MVSTGPPSELPVPGFFDAAAAGEWAYRPDEAKVFGAAADWRRRHALRPAQEDARRTLLLLVDVQKDFCHPGGALFVDGGGGDGAVGDSARIASFVYRNLSSVTDIVCTLDSHLPHHIFFPSFWVDSQGASLGAHREVSANDVASGRVTPSPVVSQWIGEGGEWLARQVEFYCRELERSGRYRLYLWPPHCLLGSEGHLLVGVVQEARLFHSIARGAQAPLEIKGLDRLTESYSVLGPEVGVAFDGRPLSTSSSALADRLLAADRIVVAGQAASHCVRSTLLDLRDLIERRRPALMSRVFVLRDCMSSVVVTDPESAELLVDFRPHTERALAELAAAGMRIMDSTDRLEG